MSVIQSDLLLGAPASGYTIQRSLRFNSADSAYLSRTPSSAGNRKTWTWSGWVKRSSFGTFQTLFGGGPTLTDTTYAQFGFNTADQFVILAYSFYWRITTQVFRDPSAWFHVVVAFDTTQATASNRIKLYINGTQVTTFSSSTDPTLNQDLGININAEHRIGDHAASSPSYYLNGYLAEIHFIDGQALDPTSFGEFDANNVWQPKAFSGTYGTNGFQLKFADNSAATATTLGKDTSGNGNNWTPNNLSVQNSGLPYRTYWNANAINPIGCFNGATSFSWPPLTVAVTGTTATWTPPSPIPFSTLEITGASNTANGLQVNGIEVIGAEGTGINVNTITWSTLQAKGVSSPLTSVAILSLNSSYGGGLYQVKVNGSPLIDSSFNSNNDSLVDTPTSYGTDDGLGGSVRGNYATLNPLSGSSTHPLANGNLEKVSTSGSGNRFGTIGITSGKFYWENAFTVIGGGVASCGISSNGRDANNISELKIYETFGTKYNGSSSSAYGASWGANDVIGIAFDADNGTLAFYKNGVSQGTAFTGLTGLTWFPVFRDDGGYSGWINFGQRPFAYTAPSGFKALCTANLPTPAISNGATAMDVLTWTGNGSARSITGLNFNPDLVWIKGRSGATDHALYDSVRGAEKRLESNNTDSEVTSDGGVTAFNSDGFSLGTLAQVNTNSATYAGWCWDAGTSTVTNTSGSISSQVRANASAGFSIVTYTGNLTGAGNSTIGHGLGVAPSLVITKSRSNSSRWAVQHSSLGSDDYLSLNTTDAVNDSASTGGGALPKPTSTVFYGSWLQGLNVNGETFVAYCFAPVAGFSAFGSYTGNGSADGPFVFTGFRPRWLLWKASSAAGYDWRIIDTARDQYNASGLQLYPNTSGAEADYRSSLGIDLLSNGFKLRNGSFENTNGVTYIYAAFAEHPFRLARAR